MKQRALKMFLLAFLPFGVLPPVLSGSPQQGSLQEFKDNRCVSCHSEQTSPASLINRFYDWSMSKHKEKGVSCDKCHGGDPKVSSAGKAHAEVVQPSKAESKLSSRSLPETCGVCHQQIVSAFVQSTHAQKLQAAEMGPTCTTCHAHMASAVISGPSEAAALCTVCHNTANGLLPARPEIPKRAGEVMESLIRCNGIFVWIDQLANVAQQRKIDISAETSDLASARKLFSQAKVDWHSVALDDVQKNADEAFKRATKVKDLLMKKLYH